MHIGYQVNSAFSPHVFLTKAHFHFVLFFFFSRTTSSSLDKTVQPLLMHWQDSLVCGLFSHSEVRLRISDWRFYQQPYTCWCSPSSLWAILWHVSSKTNWAVHLMSLPSMGARGPGSGAGIWFSLEWLHLAHLSKFPLLAGSQWPSCCRHSAILNTHLHFPLIIVTQPTLSPCASAYSAVLW